MPDTTKPVFRRVLALIAATLLLAACGSAKASSDDEGKILVGVNPHWPGNRFVYRLGTLDGCTFYEVDASDEHVFMRCKDGATAHSSAITQVVGKVIRHRYDEGNP